MHDDELDRLLDTIARPDVPTTHLARVLAADRSASPTAPVWSRGVRWAVPAAAVILATLWLYPRDVVVPSAPVSSPRSNDARVLEHGASESSSVASAPGASSTDVMSAAIADDTAGEAERSRVEPVRAYVPSSLPVTRAASSARVAPVQSALDDEHMPDGVTASVARGELAPLPLTVIPISVAPIQIGPVADAAPTVIVPIDVEPIVIDALPLDPSPQEHP